MPRQSHFLVEEEMTNPIYTDIPVTSIALFRTFLDANDMDSFDVGYYNKPDDHWKGMSTNYICYSNNDPNFLIESNLMHMKLKYGGLVSAFKDFYRVIINR